MLILMLSLARMESTTGSRFITARGAGMGDAYLPLAKDAVDALFYNPASIGKLNRFKIEPLYLQLQTSPETFRLVDTPMVNFFNLDQYKSNLYDNENQNAEWGVAIAPTVSYRGFAFGVMAKTVLSAEKLGEALRKRVNIDLIPTAGFSLRLAKGIVRIGYVVQYIHKAFVDDTRSISVPNNWFLSFYKGSGLSHNVGYALTLPFTFLPSLNVVARNIGNLSYSSANLISIGTSLGTPPDELFTLDASISIEPKIIWGSYLNLVFVYRDIFNASQTSIQLHPVFGAELSFRDRILFRLGVGLGYFSGGFGFKTNKGDFSLALYTEETSTIWYKRPETRMMVQYQSALW